MRARRSRRTNSGDMPSSMLDLIWILLFFFLMISTIRHDQTDDPLLVERVPILEEGQSVEPNDAPTVVVSITARGEILLDGDPLAKERIHDEFARLAATDGGAPLLILDVAREARVDDLLRAEDVARALGLECVVRRERVVEKLAES